MYIYIYIYIHTDTYIFTFFCFSIHYMCDASVACITSVHFIIISLVTGKTKYEINALMMKDSYDNI